MPRHILPAALLALAAPLASAQSADPATLTIEITSVPSSDGTIQAALCADPQAAIPGPCGDYRAVATATSGTTSLTFQDVQPGRYALQFWHDANGNNRPDIPPEGYGYGNDAAWPPTFEAAAIDVATDTTLQLKLQHVPTQFLPTTAPEPQEQLGVDPPSGVERIAVRDDGLYGALYLPDRDHPRPALILLGGSEGGLEAISQIAPSFAKQGYATLALAYWGAPGLPEKLENLPLEYFDTAISWLQANPAIDADSIGIMGWSRGSEAALLAASRNPAIKAVGAIAPSGIVWQGLDFDDMTNTTSAWTLNGEDLPYVIPDPTKWQPNRAMTAMFAASLAEADARPETQIPVERINAPILLISGESDNLWPSTAFSRRIKQRLAAQDFPHPVVHLDYPDAGHVVFIGESDAPMSAFADASLATMGGIKEANHAAWKDNWPKALAFFDAALKGQD